MTPHPSLESLSDRAPSRLRKLPCPAASSVTSPAAPPLLSPSAPPPPRSPSPNVPPTLAPPTAHPPPRSPDPAPLAPGRYKLQITLDEGTRQKLKQLQDLLAHRILNGDPARIVELDFDALLLEVHKRKTGITDKPRASKPVATPRPRTRAIPAAVRREVWARDQGRCGFVGADGHRCNETRCVEFAHMDPWGKRGENAVGNLALRCQAHNAFEADRDYGASFMASQRSRAQRPRRKHQHESHALTKPLSVREPIACYEPGFRAFATESASTVSAPASSGRSSAYVTRPEDTLREFEFQLVELSTTRSSAARRPATDPVERRIGRVGA